MRKTLCIIGMCCLFLTACTGSRYHTTPQGGLPHATLERQAKVLVAVPADGDYQGEVYAGSGLQVAKLFEKHLNSRSRATTLASGLVGKETAITKAQELTCQYVLIPIILNWEPRASTWSGRPGRATVIVSIYDVSKSADGTLINDTRLEVQGKNYHTQHPIELMNKIIADYIQKICP